MLSGHWDVVLANIHKNVLTGDMPRYAKLMTPGGRLYLSGFFEGDAPAMKHAVESSGLVVLKLMAREGWACMHCGKPS
jgi:ribosomal protein L11 methyltransferase